MDGGEGEGGEGGKEEGALKIKVGPPMPRWGEAGTETEKGAGKEARREEGGREGGKDLGKSLLLAGKVRGGAAVVTTTPGVTFAATFSTTDDAGHSGHFGIAALGRGVAVPERRRWSVNIRQVQQRWHAARSGLGLGMLVVEFFHPFFGLHEFLTLQRNGRMEVRKK
jgi:hypothetical protein